MDRVQKAIKYKLKEELIPFVWAMLIFFGLLYVGPYLFANFLKFTNYNFYLDFLRDTPGTLTVLSFGGVVFIYFFIAVVGVVRNTRLYTQVGITRRNQFLIEVLTTIIFSVIITVTIMLLGYIKQIKVGDIVYWVFDSAEPVSKNPILYFFESVVVLINTKFLGNTIGIVVNKLNPKYSFTIVYGVIVVGNIVLTALTRFEWFTKIVLFLEQNSLLLAFVGWVILTVVFYKLVLTHQSKPFK